MSRIRTVKPELFKHEELFDAEQNSNLPLRLAFIGLFTVADCEGRFKWRPRTLKLDVLPHDFIDFAAVLDALERTGFLERYEVDGEMYGLIPSFTRHQIFQTKEQARGSQFPQPPPPSKIRDDSGTVPEPSRNGEGTCRESQEGKGKEGKGKGKEEEAQAPCASLPVSPVIVSPATEATPPKTKAVKAPKPAKTIKAQIPQDWTPAETTYAMLEKQGIDRPFAESVLDEFRLYWQERGESRPGWESTFVNNAKRQWEHRSATKQNPPRNGERYAPPSRAMSPEVAEFDDILRNLNTKNLKPVIEGECSHVAH